MRLSEFIRLLEGFQRREGDLEVVVREWCTVPQAVRSLEKVRLDKLRRKDGRRRFDEIDNSATNTSTEQVISFE